MPTKKEQCVKIMGELFGPSTAKLIEQIPENEVVDKCRIKVKAFFGDEKAKIFDKIV